MHTFGRKHGCRGHGKHTGLGQWCARCAQGTARGTVEVRDEALKDIRSENVSGSGSPRELVGHHQDSGCCLCWLLPQG